MVDKRNCSFCGREIEPGTGMMFIRKDASIFNFCSSKCRKNMIHLERIPRRTRWTTAFVDMKAAGLSKEARSKPEDAEAEISAAAVKTKPVPKAKKVPKAAPAVQPKAAEPKPAKPVVPKSPAGTATAAKPGTQPAAPKGPAVAKPVARPKVQPGTAPAAAKQLAKKPAKPEEK